MPPVSSVPASWREPVLANRFYAPACFAYSAVGVFVWHHQEALQERLPVPWTWQVQAIALILQGFACFGADVVALGRPSWLHMVDMVLAVVLTCSIVVIFLLLPLSLIQFAFGWCILILGQVAFFQSRRSRKLQWGPDSFARWHALWHLVYPLGGIAGVAYTVSLPQQANEHPAKLVQTAAWCFPALLACLAALGLAVTVVNRPSAIQKEC
eukprot:gnl/TRDRNA2_/TRDRNA2_87635_c0_seq1.p1 gnl/TRDRNA2_/TRDRNA2_87635_c0~~gnl/TRDRNA2_/TRDRNA2_87635_c0_seq1.p1  ORF type:complete len:211 (-),score=14.74 gnl/TRDRNA2_/TRDRNA2_87635_c0_seq1:47-679(-)